MKRFLTNLAVLMIAMLPMFAGAQAQCNDAATGNTSLQTAYNLGTLTANSPIFSPQFCATTAPGRAGDPDYYRLSYNGATYYVQSRRGDTVTIPTSSPYPYILQAVTNPGALGFTLYRNANSSARYYNYISLMDSTGTVLSSNYSTDSLVILYFNAPVQTSPTFSLPNTIGFTATAGTVNFSVSASNVAWWQASGTPTWCTFSTLNGGNGTATIAATCQANTGAARSAVVYFSVMGSSGLDTLLRTMTITQAAGALATGVSTNISGYGFTANSSSASILVTGTNTGWTATQTGTWFTVTPLVGGIGATTCIVTATPNNTTSTRTGTVVFTPTQPNLPSVTITLTQAGLACVADAYEPNNDIATATNVGTLGGGTVTYGNLCLTAGDNDYFKVRINNRQYYVNTRGFTTNTAGTYGLSMSLDSAGNGTFLTYATSAGTATDTYLELRDSLGTIIAFNDDYNGVGYSRIVYSFLNGNLPSNLNVSNTQLIVPATGRVDSVSLTAVNTTWTAVSSATWATPTLRQGGAGTFGVGIVTSANTVAVARQATITFTGVNVTPVIVYITQSAGVQPNPCNEVGEPNETPQLARNIGTITSGWSDTSMCLSAGDNDYLKFNFNNQVFYAHVRGFTPNTVGSYALTISGSGQVLTLTTSMAGATRTDTYLTLYDSTGVNRLAFNDDFGGTFFSQVIYSASLVPTLDISAATHRIINTGGSASMTVLSSRINWTITGAPSWLTVSPSAGIGGSTLVVMRAGINYDSVPRQAILSVVGGGFNYTVTVTQAGTTPLPNCTDIAEPNNSAAAAYNLGTVATSRQDSTFCLGINDIDFYRVQFDTNVFLISVRPYNPTNRNNLGRYGLSIVRNGEYATIRTTLPGGSNADTYLTICKLNGAIIAQNNDATPNSLYSLVTIPITNRPPTNDEPCNATVLAVGDSTNTPFVLSHNVNATISTAAPSTGLCVSIAGDVWFKTTMPASGVMTVRTTIGSMRDAVMAIYKSTRCDSMQLYMGCEDDNRDGNGSWMPVITVRGNAGDQIYIRIWGFARQQGTFNIGVVNYATPNIIGGGSTNAKASNQNNNALDLRLAPNPASQTATVTVKALEDNAAFRLRLFNIAGQEVMSQDMPLTIGLNTATLGVADLPTGIYILKAGDKNYKLQIAR
ncbi:MAG: hypothetical protein RL757_95 [Bacteroidota bacterium]|jgi:hypothetical protein